MIEITPQTHLEKQAEPKLIAAVGVGLGRDLCGQLGIMIDFKKGLIK